MQSPKLSSQITADYILVNYVGTFGKFQKWLTVYMCFLIGPLMAFNMTTQLLILVIPPHWCSYDAFETGLSSTNAAEKANFIPRINNDTFHSCSMYQNINLNSTAFNSKTVYCPNGWKYDNRLIYSTPVSENSWVCKQSWRVYFIHSMYWASSAIGVIVFGVLSDHYGRVKATKICFSLSGIAGIATVFVSKNFYLFVFFRMMMGFCAYEGMIPLIHVTEFVDSSKRLLVSMGYFAFMSLTSGLLPWFAYSIGNWKLLSLVTSSLMFLVPLISIFMPESVRWLMAKGKINQAKKNIEIVATFNGQVTSGYILDNIQFFTKPSQPLRRIFSYRKFLVSSAFVGSNVYSSTLSKHPFFLISANSLIDIISAIAVARLADKFGRKKVTFYNCFLCFIFFSSTVFLKKSEQYLMIDYSFITDDSKIFLVAFFLARLTLTAVFNIKLLYGPEVYPTAVRNRAVAVRMAIGSIGCFISPLIVGLRFLNQTVCLLIFGIFIALAGIIMIFLPETKGKQLPETLDDTEN
ncbi:solute carrier family 22 member 6-like protein, partial [Leptotrombidium deliense]